MENETETQEVVPFIPDETKNAVKALALLLFYSFLMFSLPFVAFFGVKHVLRDTYHIDGFVNTAWSVFAAVIVVNIIICAYIYHAYHDINSDEEKGDVSDKAKLNSKVD